MSNVIDLTRGGMNQTDTIPTITTRLYTTTYKNAEGATATFEIEAFIMPMGAMLGFVDRNYTILALIPVERVILITSAAGTVETTYTGFTGDETLN